MRMSWLLLLLLSLTPLCHRVSSVSPPETPETPETPSSAAAGLLAPSGGSTTKTPLTVGTNKSVAGGIQANTSAAVTMGVMTVTNSTTVPQNDVQTQPSLINNTVSTTVFTSVDLASAASSAGTFIDPNATAPTTTAPTTTAPTTTVPTTTAPTTTAPTTTAPTTTAPTTTAPTTTVPTVLTAATPGSGSLLASPSVVKVQTPVAVLSKEPPTTKPSVMQTEQPQHMGALNITKVSTPATAKQQPMIHLTTASDISKEERTFRRNGQLTSTATEAARNPGATNGAPNGAPTLTTAESRLPEMTSGSTSLKTSPSMQKTFQFSLNNKQETEKDKVLMEVCKRLMANFQDGNCTLLWKDQNGKAQFENVEISGRVKTSLAAQYYEEITKKPGDNKTLIAILASCGALLIMIFILAVCASHHRRPYSDTQQHLTEELHAVENGYHDNPTLEVMEVQPEMQEKKVALNGEFSDSWIVPIDNLLKEDIHDEEDTHL